jgi:integrase
VAVAEHAAHDGLPEDLEELWSDFRRSLQRRNRSPRTIGVYREKFDMFWRWALAAGEPLDPADVDHLVLNRWNDWMLATPATRNGKPIMVTDPTTGERVPKLLEASTRRIAFRNLRPFFSWYAREFDVANPFDRADTPGDDQPVPIPVVDLDQARRLLAVCQGKGFIERRDTALLLVLADTGARLGELVNLKVDDWDRRSDLLLLDGKTGMRAVPVGTATGEALARYLRLRKSHPDAALPALWLGGKGRLSESGVAQLLRRRCEEAGIPRINPHRFRHTWAHEFRAAGGSEGDLMYLAGWSSSAMAHRYGRSTAAERAQKAARTFSLGDRL